MKKILITGAGGTVGLMLTKFFLSQGNEVFAIDRSEDSIAKLIEIKQEDRRSSGLQVEPGDILNKVFLEKVIQRSKVDVIIHCAALKHLSVGFYYPEKMAFENIVSFLNIMQLSRISESVKKVILCSSDKAAQQKSTMGASKRFLEILGENANTDNVKYVAVRFGNILHSNGSLTRIIDKKIVENEPFVIRDKRMTRYLLTNKNVIDLMTFAMREGSNGDICSIDTPSAKVIDVVRNYLAKKEANIPVTLGKNHMGESIHESLFNNSEMANVSRVGNYFVYNKNKKGNLNKNDGLHVLSSQYFNANDALLSKII